MLDPSTPSATCDFDGSPDPVWRYPARDALAPPSGIPGWPDMVSTGSWAACAKCAEFIERGDAGGLARFATTALRWRGIPAKVSLVRPMHDVFWRARILDEPRRPYVALPGESVR